MTAPASPALAQSLIQSQQFAEAEALLRPMLAQGGPIELWQMLVTTLRQQARNQEASEVQKMLVDARPGNYAARFDLSEILLQIGDFERGWREYHYRYNLPHTAHIGRKVQTPRWDGRSIAGKTLLIHDEQGYGDTLQFMRLVKQATAQSQANIILQIDRSVISFAMRMQMAPVIITREALPPAFDLHCEMMSLPMAMGLKLSDLPGQIPYLRADPARLERWKTRLAQLPRPLVALNWAGRPTHPNDANRSMPFARLAALAGNDITFLSIQKGSGIADAKALPENMRFIDLSSEIEDFDDTAAILAIADLLISIDSSPVHLAGALGRPAWVLLPYIAEWRWLENREDSPWYPAARLFRQQNRGDWTELMQRVSAALGAWRKTL